MSHLIRKVEHFKIVQPYTLLVTFDDGIAREINFKPVLNGALYTPLLELAFFNQVKIDKEIHTLVWPNGADFDPETLYKWDEYIDELTERAALWANET